MESVPREQSSQWPQFAAYAWTGTMLLLVALALGCQKAAEDGSTSEISSNVPLSASRPQDNLGDQPAARSVEEELKGLLEQSRQKPSTPVTEADPELDPAAIALVRRQAEARGVEHLYIIVGNPGAGGSGCKRMIIMNEAGERAYSSPPILSAECRLEFGAMASPALITEMLRGAGIEEPYSTATLYEVWDPSLVHGETGGRRLTFEHWHAGRLTTRGIATPP